MTEVTGSCARCSRLFTYERTGHERRYCSDGCRLAAKIERNRVRYRETHGLPPAAEPPERPRLPPMPPAPDWSRAFCQRAPSHMRPYWTSTIPAEREAASHACRTRCPVQAECELWSLALPLNDSAVYAGLSQAERRRRRLAIRDEITRQALAGWRYRLPWPERLASMPWNGWQGPPPLARPGTSR
jgi:hypothetical protein